MAELSGNCGGRRLRPYKPCDAETIAGWIHDEKTLRQWSADRFGEYPVTAADIKEKYMSNCDYECDNFYPMTALDENGVVGHFFLRYVDKYKKTLRFGFVIIDDSKRGKGYGKSMLFLAKKLAFEIMGAEKVTLGVFENNPSAYHFYIAMGFVDTGKDYYCTLMGEQWRCIEMECTR